MNSQTEPLMPKVHDDSIQIEPLIPRNQEPLIQPLKKYETLYERTIISAITLVVTIAFSILWYLHGEKLLHDDENRAETMKQWTTFVRDWSYAAHCSLSKGLFGLLISEKVQLINALMSG
ncbi:hypothetical protein COLO4_26773 [Corchorus olitorius]|uniref:Uncharacterized protein n=1 Tax=Corchorus olitorius TaxID=93759 RepID=A0A1R3HUA5_9ROSI|nr:hypothetical protein COLO4_26773 [Corchorus olitorius]